MTGLDGVARRIEAPLIGRLEELAVLQDEFDRAGDDRATRWLTVLGSAGVGKSRLVDEFLTSLPTATRLRGRCISYGEGVAFLPLIELIRSAVAIDETMPSDTARARLDAVSAGRIDISDRLAPLLGLSERAYPLEGTFWAVRRLMETLAETAPVVVVFEDVHWAEVTFLDLIEDLACASAGPLLIICTARDEVLEERPTWGQQPTETLLRLDALGASAIERILAIPWGPMRSRPSSPVVCFE